MSFDPNADPIALAARAAELALEQNERLRNHMKKFPTNDGTEFYKEPFEIGISNQIATMLGGYAVLMGYVTLEEASR